MRTAVDRVRRAAGEQIVHARQSRQATLFSWLDQLLDNRRVANTSE
jgi:hypothetical protein